VSRVLVEHHYGIDLPQPEIIPTTSGQEVYMSTLTVDKPTTITTIFIWCCLITILARPTTTSRNYQSAA